MNAAQELAEAQRHFFLPRRYRDPFYTSTVSTESFVTYDIYDLLMVETRDPLGNVVTVATQDDTGNTAIRIDYRVLQPYWVTDPNGNRTRVLFDALGMVAGTAVMGKPPPAQVEGDLLDLLDGFEPDLTQAQIDAFLVKPREPGAAPSESVATQIVHDLLGQASTRIVYDLDRFKRLGKPPFAATIARETHVRNLADGERSKLQVSFSYSDGFGREIQKKIQAEPGPLVEGGPSIGPRWVGSGWTIFNNKGKPVRQYEPFFDDTHDFKFANQVGVSPILFYDPVERVVATLHPNHTYEKVVFDPWRQETWDVNDTALIADPGTDTDVGGFFSRLPSVEYQPTWYALRTDAAYAAAFAARYPDPTDRTNETRAAEKTAIHAGTPSIAHADSLGRTFLTIAHNRFKRNDTILEEKYATRVVFDIEGNQREVIDALGRVVMRYAYDMLGTRIHQASMEAGERWILNDVAGQPLHAWDSRGHQFRTTYDALRRPIEQTVRGTTAESDPRTLNRDILVDKIEYGEPPTGANQAELDRALRLNLRTRIYRHSDSAGVATNARLDANGNPTEAYDFKGNLLRRQRQLAKDYKGTLDWSANPELETQVFTGSTVYDALNRPISATSPDGSVYHPTFNEANLLEKVDVHLRGAQTATPFVTDIDYDTKGQRMLIEYGNRVKTTYMYDLFTFRLTNLITTRTTDNRQLQNLSYAYDPAGNITHIQDDADTQNVIFFRNQRVEPSNNYVYDALYRLIEATGREHLGQVGGSPIPHSYDDALHVGLLHPGDGNAMGTYSERYVYDAVGNFQEMQHQGSDPVHPGWTRAYDYLEPSLIEPNKKNNRLTSTTVGNTNPATETYPYDAHGNMLSMAHLPKMEWDFKDELRTVDLGGGGTAYYVYDASGQRVRKVVEKNNGTLIEERIYLGGFEVYRERQNSVVVLERETLHVMDNKQRIALVETRTHGDDGSPAQLIRYQFSNHLGSASLELDDAGHIISYEEYYPYGSTSYQAVRSGVEVSVKRYRYTGMERDEESGLSYHGARYYAPWVGRWVSCDPAGLNDGVNPYSYASDRPLTLIDPSGMEGERKKLFDYSFTGEESDEEVRRIAYEHGYIAIGKLTWDSGWFAEDVKKKPAWGMELSDRSFASDTSSIPAGDYSLSTSNTGEDYDPFAPKKSHESGKTTRRKTGGGIPGGKRTSGPPGGSANGSINGTLGGTEGSASAGGGDGGSGGGGEESSWFEKIFVGVALTLATFTVGGALLRIGMAALRYGIAYAATTTAPVEITALGLGMAGYTVPAARSPGASFSNLLDEEIDTALGTMSSKYYYRSPVDVSEAGIPLETLVPSSRWGRPGLQPGDWIMNGPPSLTNYGLSFKWERHRWNTPAPFSVGEGYILPPDWIKWPSGLGGMIRGLYGQRRYLPPPQPPKAQK